MGLFFELLIAALAVFGLWCLLHLIVESLLTSRHITVAVDLREPSGECADELLTQGARMLSCRRGQTVLLICTREWACENGAEALAERYGARLCVVESITPKAK
jgi:hypothetical protein